MASLTDFPTTRPSLIQRAFAALSDWLDSFARARAAAAEFDYLDHLTDRQLAERGLDRTAIAHHVMARHLDV